MDNITKQQILARLYQIDIQVLIAYIESGDLTIEEMVLSGNLNRSQQEEIEKYKEEILARIRKEDIENERRRVSEEHIDNILHNRYKNDKILDLVDSGVLTITDLEQKTPIRYDDLIRELRIRNTLKTDFSSWADLPKLEEGRTDVYMFGVIGSGKSSLLAGVLFYGNREGYLLRTNLHNTSGFRYAGELIQRVTLGVVPDPTHDQELNYIAVDFMEKDEKTAHLITIIEMGGKKFTDTYTRAIIDGAETIGARDYLKNNNKKIILFVIDYRQHESKQFSTEIPQGEQLQMVLSLMSADGTLDKTSAVFIVVTKSDTIPSDLPPLDGAIAFLEGSNNGYKSFLTSCRVLSKKHRFDVVVHAFSLGRFATPESKTYQYNPESSKNIFNDILRYSPLPKKSKWSFNF